MTYVFGDETVDEVVRRIMHQVQKLGVKVRFLLLDRGFFNADVIRYLQAARYLPPEGGVPFDPFAREVMIMAGRLDREAWRATGIGRVER